LVDNALRVTLPLTPLLALQLHWLCSLRVCDFNRIANIAEEDEESSSFLYSTTTFGNLKTSHLYAISSSLFLISRLTTHRLVGTTPLLRERDCLQPDFDYELQL
jgi:hypothetical protein